MVDSWISVFKTGKHTDSAGNEKTWTEADLDAIAAKYQPSGHEAPVVIGHPADNAPAWGWVESLKRQGPMLLAKLKDVAPEFADMVRKGLFKKRSISLYPDMSLRHIGFLGAMPPAVKGLPDVAFRACEAGVTVEFATDCKNCKSCVKNFDSAGVPPAGQVGQASSLAITKFLKGKEKKSMFWKDWLKSRAEVDGVPLEFGETSKDAGAATQPAQVNMQALVDAEVARKVAVKELEFAEQQRRLDAAKVEIQKKADELKKAEGERLKGEITAFCDSLCKAGKLTPAARKQGMGLDTFMEKISGIQEVVEFSEGGKQVKQTPLEYMKNLLGSAKKQIEFGEVASQDKDFGVGSDKREAVIADFMEKNKTATYKDAVLAASAKHPGLFAV